jgi:hypothetical protein
LKALIKITIVVCLLLSSFSKGQSLFFDKYYKVGYPTAQSNNVLMLEDSTYVILSYVKDSLTGRQDLGLHKVDKYGNLLVKKITNYFGFDYLRPGNSFNNFIHSSKTSLISVAATYSGTISAVIFTKISKQNLDTIKTSLLSDGFFYNIGNLIKIRDNKFFAIGNKGNTTSQWPVIFELDSNLTISNTINSLNTNSVATFFADYDKTNKNFILGGSVTIGMNFYSFISKMDTLGSFISTFINNDGVGNGLAQIFYSAYDNAYVTIGNKKTSVYGSQNFYRFHVCKYNASSLSKIWEKTYGHSNMVNALYDATINPDGSIVIVGRYSDSLLNPLTNINCNAALLKIRSNGDSLWMKQFDNLNNTSGPSNNWWEGFFGIEKTPEAGYIMCGNAQQMPLAEAWVVKTDSLGCALASCMPFSGIYEETPIQYGNIYPNPASTIIYLNLPKGILYSEIEIINTLGMVVAKYPYSTEKINIEKLSSGTYFIKVQTQDYIPNYSKFIKE